MKENSRWDLPDEEVGRYLARSYDFIIDLLQRMDHSEPYRLDPSGDEALRMAKKVRRRTLREAGDDRLNEEADRFFGMPDTQLPFSRDLAEPIYAPARVASN
jgi:hypothetical protein